MRIEKKTNWLDGIQVAITYCDADGIINDMNSASIEVFSKDGGEKLIGENILDCHPEPGRTKLKELMDHPRLNVYSIEKNGRKKLIYQAPVMDGEKYLGILEISLPIPNDIPHFIRANK
jgi:sensor histidine kinase regulating citrate/malate metabolism